MNVVRYKSRIPTFMKCLTMLVKHPCADEGDDIAVALVVPWAIEKWRRSRIVAAEVR